MSYESYDSALVELFEYKVADLVAGKLPRSGKLALHDLRDYLMDASLDSTLMRRMRRADRTWRTFEKEIHVPSNAQELQQLLSGGLQGIQVPAITDALAVQHADARNEWDILQQLRSTLFHFDLYTRAQAQAQHWVTQKNLHPLRVTLALLQALQQVAPNSEWPALTLAAALNYTDLHRPDQAAQVLGALTQHLCSPISALPNNHQRVRAVLRGLLTAPLPQAVLGIKTIKEEEYDQEQLQHTLYKLLAYAAQGDMPVGTAPIQPLLDEAVQQLSAFLDSGVPHSMGGRGPELPLLGGLLYARGQAVRLEKAEDTALSLAIHLSGGDQVGWRGHHLRWRRLAQDGWEIIISDPEGEGDFVRLNSAQPLAESRLAGEPIHLALIGDDLAVERRPKDHRDLAALVLEARLSAALLEPEDDYANLRLARAVAMKLRGNDIVPEKVSAQSAAAYASVPTATLLAFARQGANTLIKSAPLVSHEQLGQAFAHALIATQVSPPTVQALINLLTSPPDRLALPVLSDYSTPAVSDGTQHAVLLFRGEPLTVRVMNQPLTLRNDYKGELSAIVPGVTTAQVGDLLALPLTSGAVVVVRQGERIAVGFQPKAPHLAAPQPPVPQPPAPADQA